MIFITPGETCTGRRRSAAGHVGCRVHDPLYDPALKACAFDSVIDAVGGGEPGKPPWPPLNPGILVHIGLMDADGEWDIRISRVCHLISFYNDMNPLLCH